MLTTLDEIIADMGGPLPGTTAHQLQQVRDAVAELVAVQRGHRDMLREAAKQFRLCGQTGHAVMCDHHASDGDGALVPFGGAE